MNSIKKYSPFVENLRKLLESKGLQRSDFAKKINVSLQTIDNWLTEKTYPGVNQLLIIAEILNVTDLNTLVKGSPVASNSDLSSRDEIMKLRGQVELLKEQLGETIEKAVERAIDKKVDIYHRPREGIRRGNPPMQAQG